MKQIELGFDLRVALCKPRIMKKLPKSLYDRVKTSLEKGNEFLDGDRSDRALEEFERALGFIPEPRDDYEVTYEVLAAIGDVHWFNEDFEEALETFESAQKIFGAAHQHYQPFLLLRIGQCCYELEDEERARTLLKMGLEAIGAELFEEEDPKYLELVS